ncbi:putative metal-dependent peptidase [Sulfuritortus calidifontis]|uniref:Putative metal-dependent peptidase n=1 Tax=Sulfuritortus calidifontis TaxID=1914471 RepID=A0A4R3JX93_9PROT|nr:VWA-like domain-containing protein [Sulfuritortus calidifontis]TCS73008.1 putative metal-dependent peptidase [Sulfuritortus calidifontis]
MSQDTSAIETKLAAARTRLILDKPFLGSLVMHLPLKAADPKWCKTTATDARAFYYNADYIARLTLEQTQFVLAHEAMHCALSHFARRNHRQKHRWDVACDYAVNMILDDERMPPPDEALMNAAYRGLTAEEIYPLLHEDPPEETMDQHLFDQENDTPPQSEGEPEGRDTGAGEPREAQSGETEGEQDTGSQGGSQGRDKNDQPGQGQQAQAQESQDSGEAQSDLQEQPPPPPMDPDKLSEQWKSRLAAAAQAARQAGKLSASLMRFVDNLLAPQLPWRALLARYMMNAARDDYSFQRTSRREGEALMPRLYSQSVNVVVALDTSGSVTDEELREFLAEIDALKGQVRAEITLHACDDKLAEAGPWRYAMWEPVTLPAEVAGGGGTDFRPVFDWVNRDRLSPDLLVYFTDAEGAFPEQAPPYPVVWLVKGKAPVPFGVRIQLN